MVCFLELLQFASSPRKTGAFLQAGCPSYCPPNVRVLKATQSTIFVNLVKAPTSCHSFLVHQLTPEGKIATPSIYCWQYSICGYLRMWIPKCAIGVNNDIKWCGCRCRSERVSKAAGHSRIIILRRCTASRRFQIFDTSNNRTSKSSDCHQYAVHLNLVNCLWCLLIVGLCYWELFHDAVVAMLITWCLLPLVIMSIMCLLHIHNTKPKRIQL